MITRDSVTEPAAILKIYQLKMKRIMTYLCSINTYLSYCCFLWIIQYLPVVKNSQTEYLLDRLTMALYLKQWIKMGKYRFVGSFLSIWLDVVWTESYLIFTTNRDGDVGRETWGQYLASTILWIHLLKRKLILKTVLWGNGYESIVLWGNKYESTIPWEVK